MDATIRDKFTNLWEKHFHETQLPIVFYYTNSKEDAELPKSPSRHRCVIADISAVRRGKPLCLDADSISCGDAKRYLGFTEDIMPNFEYCLSSGLSGKVEDEKGKKDTKSWNKTMKRAPLFKAPGKFIVFKRWDELLTSDEPEVVVFFAQPEVMSDLFTLSTFDEAELKGVFSPFDADCATVVQYPYLEKDSDRPRAVLGMFDISPRPGVPWDVHSFSVPMIRFIRMINNMEKSFFIS